MTNHILVKAIVINVSANFFKKKNKFSIEILNLFSYYYFITMKNGTVKFFNDAKGFGFVTDDETNEEYFVHVSGLIDEIKEGDKVEFDLKEGRKGLNAIDVKVI